MQNVDRIFERNMEKTFFFNFYVLHTKTDDVICLRRVTYILHILYYYLKGIVKERQRGGRRDAFFELFENLNRHGS